MDSSRLPGLLILLPLAMAAHELEVTVSFAAPAVILRAAYGGSEPVPFAKVQVFAPSAASTEFQTAHTDKRGAFSFVPEGPGAWRVIVDDEEGHRREVAVAVPDPFQAGSGSSSPNASASSRLERALFGLALMFGGTGFLYGVTARRRRAS